MLARRCTAASLRESLAAEEDATPPSNLAAAAYSARRRRQVSRCVVTAAIATLCCGRGALAQVFTTDDFKHTFFAGAFFDPKASSSSHLVKYLVTPNASFTAGRCRALLPATAKAA